MTPDHYAALGLSPTSEDVVIRAAYLALMRRYHPDGNPSEVAAARTRAINAAYAVLGDPDKRAEYDQARAEEPWAPGPDQPPPSTAPRGLFPAAAILLLLLLVFLVVWSPLPLVEPAAPAPHGPTRAAPTNAEAAATKAKDPPTVRPDAVNEAPPVQLDKPPPAPPPRKAHPASQSAASQPTAPQPAASNPKLASLDRLQALYYSQSLGRADAKKRALLLSTDDRFVARRDACRSVSCTRETYLARMREVSDIMTAH